MADRFHVVVNPAGASGRTGKYWKELEAVLRDSGVPYEVHLSTREHRLDAICAEITASGEERDLIVIGGDGSMNEVINGIRDLSLVRIGYIPGGSGNDLARDMGLPKDRREILRTILRGQTVRISDVGTVVMAKEGTTLAEGGAEGAVQRRFIVSCGIGFDAAVCADVVRSPLKGFLNRIRLGKLIYIAIAIRLIFTTKTEPMDLVLDGERRLSFPHGLFAAVMNHRYEGGGFRFCPDASDSDGVLDLCVAHPKHTAAFFRAFPTALTGDHVRYAYITIDRAKEIGITSDRPLWVHTDGEPLIRSSDVRVSLLRERLRFLM